MSSSHGKGKTAALWAPDAEAYLCDEHALGGAKMTLLYEPDSSGATSIAVIAAKHSEARVVRIRPPLAAGAIEKARPPVPKRPPSFLLLPAAGEASANHFDTTVARAVDTRLLEEFCPREAAAVTSRITDKLAAWGLRDNTRGFPTQSSKPLIWDRIEVSTLALFASGAAYVAVGEVIGKCLSDAGSAALWGSPEFRWLIFLTAIREIDVPIEVVREGAGFDPTYRINRQALVPKAHREDALWDAIRPYLVTESDVGR